MQGHSFSSLLTVAAGLTLIAVAVIERIRSVRIEKLYADATRKLHAALAKHTGGNEPLIDCSPTPMCYANHHGDIVRASASFAALTSTPCATLADFNRKTGAALEPIGTKRHVQRVYTDMRNTTPRRYTVVSWPAGTPSASTGTVIMLIEQTRSVERERANHLFTRELIAFQESIGAMLKGGASGEVATMSDLFSRVLQLPLQQGEHIDVSSLITQVMRQHATKLRKRDIGTQTLLPVHVTAWCDAAALREALSLLLEAVEKYAHPHTTVRCVVEQTTHTARITIDLPGIHVDDAKPHHAFAFGKPGHFQEAQLRLALCRVLINEQRGQVGLTVDLETGVASLDISLPREA